MLVHLWYLEWSICILIRYSLLLFVNFQFSMLKWVFNMKIITGFFRWFLPWVSINWTSKGFNFLSVLFFSILLHMFINVFLVSKCSLYVFFLIYFQRMGSQPFSFLMRYSFKLQWHAVIHYRFTSLASSLHDCVWKDLTELTT